MVSGGPMEGERLFSFPDIRPLPELDAARALNEPAPRPP